MTAELDLRPDQSLIVVEKLFLENDLPVILAVNHIPQQLIEQEFRTDDFEMPIFEFLDQFTGNHLSYYLSEFVPVLASESLSRRLMVAESAPLLSLEEVGYDEENRPILKAYSYFRDDLLRLRFIRRQV